MNDTAVNVAAARPAAPAARATRNAGSDAQTYLLLALLVVFGWVTARFEWFNPEEGIGYWLGIVGATMMGTLLLYPLRKRYRALRLIGPTRLWFRIHMAFGLVGPLLILYHCNFQLGSFNSRFALVSMLLVAGSGIIGRHFYAAVHRGLYGRRTNLVELQSELEAAMSESRGMANLMPELVERMKSIAGELQGDRVTRTIGVGRSLHWTFTHHMTRIQLRRLARRELQAAAASSPAVAVDMKRLMRSTSLYIRDFTKLTGRVAQFSFYEKLLAMWHILHLPIFLMLVLSTLVHILAVHMY
ncbi:MAG: hypothetical protein QNI99_05770 [Woeseiaceae bacterium]|nr:hypothetical protein [Woeseiaceae bacterium]